MFGHVKLFQPVKIGMTPVRQIDARALDANHECY
jgi:hypothetical protein